MNIEEELKEGKLNSLYLLYGEETYLLETTFKKIKKIFGECIQGINYIQIDETNIGNLISDIQTPAFGYEKKLIVVKANMLKKNSKKEEIIEKKNSPQAIISKFIEENNKDIKDSVILVFIEETVNKVMTLYKTIEKYGEVCNFEKLKLNELVARLKAICNAYKVNVDSNILQYLVETCGTGMQNLINEIRKLIEYAGENGTIKKEDIDKLSIKELEAKIFDLTDNLGKKDTKKAIGILKELIYNKEPVQKILITLYNHFKKLYMCKLAEEYNQSLTEVLNLKPTQMFLISKYRNQANYFKKQELKMILNELIELDNKTKIGLLDINIGLEAILCTYC